ncbi:MAG: hypothetical protein WC229_00460 [Candidatus Paceibacterota bacterium]
MEGKKQLFNILEPKNSLKVSIIKKIKREEFKRSILKIGLSSFVSLGSAVSVVFLLVNIIRDYYRSGLSEYVSLMFSDGSALVSYWQSYVMSLIETLPIFAITLVLISIWVLTVSLNLVLSFSKNMSKVFYQFN